MHSHTHGTSKYDCWKNVVCMHDHFMFSVRTEQFVLPTGAIIGFCNTHIVLFNRFLFFYFYFTFLGSSSVCQLHGARQILKTLASYFRRMKASNWQLLLSLLVSYSNMLLTFLCHKWYCIIAHSPDQRGLTREPCVVT